MKLLIVSLFIATSVFAQTVSNSPTPMPSPFGASPDVKSVAEVAPPTTVQELEQLGQVIFAAKSASLAIYPSYDPYITVGGVKKPFGWGAALLYPVSDYAFAGVRIDFLGNTFWAPSAVVGAKYTLANFPMTPTVFTVGGLLVPVGGAGTENNTAEAVTGVGATLVLWTDHQHFSINVFAEGEKITNFPGINTHLGLAGGVKF